eukprot:3255562-Prymnesium_polylepis.2
MSGAVVEVRRFLEQGGHADTVYKEDYGWDVGPDWLFTKPNDGTTVLNYVATWTDVIGVRRPDGARDVEPRGCGGTVAPIPCQPSGLIPWLIPCSPVRQVRRRPSWWRCCCATAPTCCATTASTSGSRRCTTRSPTAPRT